MHRGILKRAICVLLIVVMCFSLAASAFASSSWYDGFLDSLLGASSAAPSGVSSAVSDILYFSALQTSLDRAAQTLLTVQGSTLPPDVSGLLKTGYQNYFDNFFTFNYSTTSSDRYVYVSFTDLQDFVRKLTNLPVTLTYFPTTGVYVPVLSSTALVGPYDPNFVPDKGTFWYSLSAAMGGSEFVEGAVLRALPYVGDYILVAPAPDREPDFFPSEDKPSSSASTNHNYYTDSSSVDNSVSDNSVTTNTTIYEGGETYNTSTFDYSNGTWYDNVSGTVNDIEDLYYNPSTNTYTINNTYNITYEYNYTYYYNLGSSENLVQDYKFYYELPDGRSSADLTADEISGLSLQFDVVNYAEDRTDENTKILVPFDGTWDDIAYEGPALGWASGASVTYKESAAFNGALYLPGSAPAAFGFDEWANNSELFTNGLTLQFRYYLDALTTPNSSTIPFLVSPFGQNSPGSFARWLIVYVYNNDLYVNWTSDSNLTSDKAVNGTKVADLATGVWSDITISCVPISSSQLRVYVYVNGVMGSYVDISGPFSNVITYSPFFAFNGDRIDLPLYYVSNEPSYSRVVVNTYSDLAMPFQMIDNLRLVDFALYDGTDFVPSPVPFDTNLVYVLPDTAGLQDNTIAVQSGIPVSGYRIGGVRPTFPDVGMVWMPLDGNKIADCQIYRGNYWESVGCRVWTGERWVPAWAFDVITLSDLWDIYGGEETDNYTEITPGSFYQWFQQHFLEFKTSVIERLDRILQALGIQTDDTDVTEPDADGNSNFTFFQFFDNLFSTQQKEESGVVADALGDLLDLAKRFVHSIAAFFSGFAVMDGLGSDYLQAASDALSGVSDLVSGVWLAIPSEIQDVTVACFMFVVFGALVAIFV